MLACRWKRGRLEQCVHQNVKECKINERMREEDCGSLKDNRPRVLTHRKAREMVNKRKRKEQKGGQQQLSERINHVCLLIHLSNQNSENRGLEKQGLEKQGSEMMHYQRTNTQSVIISYDMNRDSVDYSEKEISLETEKGHV